MAENEKKGAQWKTVGGGAPALIGDDGQILAACPGLEGEDIDDLGSREDPDNRQDREQRQEKAEASGWESSETKKARSLWEQARQDAGGELTLVQIGDQFYTFGDDAKVLQGALQMGDGETAQFDEKHLKDHLKRLVADGHRVAISESTEEGQPREAQPEAVEEAHEEVSPESEIELGDEFDDENFGTSFGFGANASDVGKDDDQSGEPADVPPPTPEPPTTETPRESTGDARAATGQQIENIPAGPVKSLVESLHDLRSVRKTGKITTSEVDPDYAKSIYDHLKKITRNGDGFGDVYDLADHLGPRALGYASPAGVLAMIPPKFKGDDWEVRYAATQDSPQAPLADVGGGYATEDEPPPEPTPTPEKPKRQPKPRKPRGVRGEGKLAQAIREAIGDDPEDQQAFKQIVDQVWRDKTQEIAEHNSALAHVIGTTKTGAARGGFTRRMRGKEDADQARGFDQMVDTALRDYPWLLGEGVAGEGGTYDPEARLMEVVKRGIVPYPARHSDEVIGEALDRVSAMESDKSYMTPEQIAELEATPFARRGWKVRYRKWAMRKLSRWRRYAKQLSLFDEQDHPRDAEGKFKEKGGDRTGKTEGRKIRISPVGPGSTDLKFDSRGSVVEGSIGEFSITTQERGVVSKISKRTQSELEESFNDPEVVSAMKAGGIRTIEVVTAGSQTKKGAPKNWTAAQYPGTLMIHTRTSEAIAKSKVQERVQGGMKRVLVHEASHGLWGNLDEATKKEFETAIKNNPSVAIDVGKIVSTSANLQAFSNVGDRAVTESFAELSAMRVYDRKRFDSLPDAVKNAIEKSRERSSQREALWERMQSHQ